LQILASFRDNVKKNIKIDKNRATEPKFHRSHKT
jgi:hypothetical protein